MSTHYAVAGRDLCAAFKWRIDVYTQQKDRAESRLRYKNVVGS